MRIVPSLEPRSPRPGRRLRRRGGPGRGGRGAAIRVPVQIPGPSDDARPAPGETPWPCGVGPKPSDRVAAVGRRACVGRTTRPVRAFRGAAHRHNGPALSQRDAAPRRDPDRPSTTSPMPSMAAKRDYYEVLGVERTSSVEVNQAVLQEARRAASPGPQPGRRGSRRPLQGDGRGVRGAVGPGQARTLRPLRPRRRERRRRRAPRTSATSSRRSATCSATASSAAGGGAAGGASAAGRTCGRG